MTNHLEPIADMIRRHDRTRDIAAAISALTDHTADCSTDPHRDDDAHDDALADFRYAIIAANDPSEPLELDYYRSAPAIRDALISLAAELINLASHLDSPARELLTRIALDHSLCPLHLIDYAICFDDDEPACSTIRMIHPDHDS